METYPTSLHHVLAERELINLLICAETERCRQAAQRDNAFQGLYISEQELDALLAGPAGLPRWAAVSQRPEVAEALGRIAQEIADRKEASVRLGSELRLLELARRFSLTLFDVDALVIALAPEIDLRYEKLFCYLQDDITKKRPSVDLVLNLLCPTFADKLAGRSRFLGTAPLLRHRLIEMFDDPSRPQRPLLARYLRADARVVS